MGLSAAALHWSPRHFWDATPHELWAGMEVWREMNAVPKSGKAD